MHKYELNTDCGFMNYQTQHPECLRPTKSIREPSWIETISVTHCPKQVHQSQHNHCVMDQANRGKVVGKIIGGSIPKIRWIEQSITFHGAGEMRDEQASTKAKPIRGPCLVKRSD